MKTLTQFLTGPQRPDSFMDFYQLQGFLFAIVCSPELIKPSEWMPFVFSNKETNFKDLEEANLILQEIMELYSNLNQQVMQGEVQIPVSIIIEADARDNIGDNTPLGRWSIGFVQGHDWLSEVWDGYLPEELDRELGSSLMVLSYFASSSAAHAFYDEIKMDKSITFAEYTRLMLDMFEAAMKDYAHLGNSITRAIEEQYSEFVAEPD